MSLTFPSIFLGLVVSTLYGVIFHFLVGGKLWRLLLYIVIGWVGFWAGHFLAEVWDWTFIQRRAIAPGYGNDCQRFAPGCRSLVEPDRLSGRRQGKPRNKLIVW
jgi:uncharacterized membrane protein YeaQ/YmgE (transglycosylase-associated protein family)